MNIREDWKEAINKLRKAHDAKAQMEQLQYCKLLPVKTPAILKHYHDALLLVCAYPYSNGANELAVAELQRLAVIIKKHQRNKHWQYALTGSGLPFSEIHCQFSADILLWLLEKFPGQVKPVSSGSPGDALKAVCLAALPQVEFYLSSNGNITAWNRLKLVSGHNQHVKALQWLLQLFRQQQWNGVLQDNLYDSLKIFVKWFLPDDIYCRSFLKWPVQKIFLRKPAEGKVNARQVIHKPGVREVRLSNQEKEELLSVIRSSLAFYLRETDPVTYAAIGETSLFDMGNGLQIVLTGMHTQRRLAIESYIGYMAFKSGIPVAYGGGWVFGYSCKIGINIYPPFRGGESERLLCEVMRLYHQRFRVKRFVVSPYQFGKGNREGLKSGAYWFYYKSGFRSERKDIESAAREEWHRIAANKTYRSPLHRLRKFTSCNMEWNILKDDTIFIDADELSKAVTAMIKQEFKGNREEATAICVKRLQSFTGYRRQRWSETERRAWQNWSLIFSCLPGTEKWTQRQRSQYAELISLKATGKEEMFIDALQRHKGFWDAAAQLFCNRNSQATKKGDMLAYSFRKNISV